MKHNDGSDHSRADTDLMISWGKNKYVRAGSAPETKEVPEKPKVPYRLEMPEVPHGSERPEVPHGSERPEVPHGSERPEVPRRAAGSSEPEIPRRTSRSSGPEPAEKGSRAILAGCNTGTDAGKYARAMAELRGLAEACGLKAVSVLVQNAPTVTHATYIGSGKVLELKKEVEEFDADIVLFILCVGEKTDARDLVIVSAVFHLRKAAPPVVGPALQPGQPVPEGLRKIAVVRGCRRQRRNTGGCSQKRRSCRCRDQIQKSLFH